MTKERSRYDLPEIGPSTIFTFRRGSLFPHFSSVEGPEVGYPLPGAVLEGKGTTTDYSGAQGVSDLQLVSLTGRLSTFG